MLLKHPTTGKPVTVSFNLPPGTHPKIEAPGRLRLEFRYDKGQPVVVRLFRNGNVVVRPWIAVHVGGLEQVGPPAGRDLMPAPKVPPGR